MSLIDKLNHFVEENMSVDEVRTTLKEYSREVEGFYLYGCGPMGLYLSKILKKLGIPFCGGVDDILESQDEYYGIKIYKTDEIKPAKKVCFVITLNSPKTRTTMEKRLGDLVGEEFEYDCISRDVLLYASRNGMNKPFQKKSITLDSTDLLVTNFCSMKCKGCSQLTPYVKPRHFACSDMKEWLDVFCGTVDYLDVLGIFGGEPFLYPDLSEVIRFAASQPNIFSIMINTNGTVVPGDDVFQSMSDAGNVMLHITDYGEPSKKKKEVIEKCREYGVQCTIRECWAWDDYGEVKDYGTERIKERADACFSNLICYTLYEGRLYYCARAAKMVEMGVYGEEFSDQESVKLAGCNPDEVRERLYDVISKGVCALPACRYCKGRGIDKMEGGVQL